MRSLLALVLVFAASGCQLYFGDGDDDCYFAEIAPAQPLRDPQTGECQAIGGQHWCDGREAPAIGIAIPDWGACYSRCDELDEGTCLGASGCRVAYMNDAITDGPPAFWGCWDVAMSGPVRGGNCHRFDAYECSRHDDCSAVYTGVNRATEPNGRRTPPEPPKHEFVRCVPEAFTACTSGDDCGPGERCTVDVECLPPPGCDATSGTSCPAVCYGRCVPQTVGCEAADCAPGTHCVDDCDGTTTPPGPNGKCDARCVPDGACAALPDELSCQARPDCYPVYLGEDCTCDPTGCTCDVLTYDRCRAWGAGPNTP